jgi:hypothetical protein
MARGRRKIVIDISRIEAILGNSSRISLDVVAKEFGISKPTARRIVTEHFGDAVMFRRGRYGGILPNPNNYKTADADTSSTPTVAG